MWTFRSNTEAHNFGFGITLIAGGTQTAAFAAGTFAVGDLLLMGIDAGGASVDFTLTDDQTNMWTRVGSGMTDRGDGYHIGVWWAVARTALQPTVSYHNSGSTSATFLSWQVVSFSPPIPGVSVDSQNPATGTGTGVISSLTTSGSDELLVGWPLSTVGSATGSHSGSTTTLAFGGNNNPFQYRNEAVAGTYDVGSDFAASNLFGCVGASFKASLAPTARPVVCIME